MSSSSSLPAGTSPAAEAYVWGYPLVVAQRTRSLFCSRAETGVMSHRDSLATPRDRGVVAVNNDTLYSSGWYDLRHGDLEIDVPPMDHPGRYWNVMVLDAYTHVAYVCRRLHGVGGTRVRVTHDPNTPPPNDGSRVVPVATPTAWVIVRVLVESPEDLETARELQRSITVRAPDSHPHQLTERAGKPTAVAAAGAAFFTELAGLVANDSPAPWHPEISEEAWAIVQDPRRFSADELVAGVEEGEKSVAGLNVKGGVSRDGWSTVRDATGFGGDILKRAVGAKIGLGGHQAIENRSYMARSAEGRPVDGSRTVQLHFGRDSLPPCNGFWSLTAYGPDLYLIENEMDRWSIGDRTPGLRYDDDGGLTITIGAERPDDISNWLPTAPGPYLLGMRVYEGHDEVVDCRWFPPPLVAVP